ncbi:hypothetical protein TNCV_4229041 [Trichonephila clavipes]|nr:hypothetical protein TNCV_4229041 [Trichonephila clavipes]
MAYSQKDANYREPGIQAICIRELKVHVALYRPLSLYKKEILTTLNEILLQTHEKGTGNSQWSLDHSSGTAGLEDDDCPYGMWVNKGLSYDDLKRPYATNFSKQVGYLYIMVITAPLSYDITSNCVAEVCPKSSAVV